MVDGIADFEFSCTTTSFTVKPDCLFVDNDCLTPDGIVENVAQTCAARMGCINFLNHEHVKLGFIGSVRDMTFHRLPHVGETLTTSIVVREEVFRMTLVDAEVRSGNEVIATAEMKIALSETDAQS